MLPDQPQPANTIHLPLYQRVVIRRRIDEPPSKFTDVKGTVYHLDETSALFQPEGQDAYLVIPLEEIAAAKPIPPRPAPRRAKHTVAAAEPN